MKGGMKSMSKICRHYVFLMFLLISSLFLPGWQVADGAADTEKIHGPDVAKKPDITGLTKEVGVKVASVCALAENSRLITGEVMTTEETLRSPEQNRTECEIRQLKEQEEREAREAQRKKKEAQKKKRKKLAASVPASARTQSSREILLRIVEAEAGDQDIRGRRLVANVILNRVKSSEFPDTVRGVVFAGRQFSPVSNGSYYRVHISEKTKKAVDQALQGIDDSQGALYFMWRAGADSSNASWFDRALTRLFRHGCHEFYK